MFFNSEWLPDFLDGVSRAPNTSPKYRLSRFRPPFALCGPPETKRHKPSATARPPVRRAAEADCPPPPTPPAASSAAGMSNFGGAGPEAKERKRANEDLYSKVCLVQNGWGGTERGDRRSLAQKRKSFLKTYFNLFPSAHKQFRREQRAKTHPTPSRNEITGDKKSLPSLLFPSHSLFRARTPQRKRGGEREEKDIISSPEIVVVVALSSFSFSVSSSSWFRISNEAFLLISHTART